MQEALPGAGQLQGFEQLAGILQPWLDAELLHAVKPVERLPVIHDQSGSAGLAAGHQIVEELPEGIPQFLAGHNPVDQPMGEHEFGKPSRITAKTAMGRGGIINIERESDLSGPTHNKGVLILTGYLRAMFAHNKPLVLSASIAFEQSYSGVDGDSASSTEIYALLSSLSGIPLRQDIAVTGSVNQHGEVQPIGGVNLKIEGFFNVCKARGLTGRQGVMIPASNGNDLMLRHEVVDAVRAGKFHIYAISTVDEGIAILTGKKAGRRLANGRFESGTVNALVDRTLAGYVKHVKKMGG
jgi:ATP-dependent Lon protease